MAEGSEGWSRYDELILGPEDDSQPENDTLEHTLASPREPAEEGLNTIDDTGDRDSDQTAEPKDSFLPETPRRQNADQAVAWGVDGTGSIPDDSPSLHVSGTIDAQLEPLSNYHRNLFRLQ